MWINGDIKMIIEKMSTFGKILTTTSPSFRLSNLFQHMITLLIIIITWI